ncbi:MAG: 4-hydroxy-3-methylbut-2-enyl diphosphate reductase [bacterium]|nr:4-hydroxy-3-methylbut-2-enyl diphosphate reductase [bacterium]MCS7310471.1 4-hydroxy-3-methylbut-2-enyl diphosphate reductase [Armatimonadota bacterium]MDW8104641.1 4-hydroxy-3-methylbut-2-enyl diphosphate reductase [Armatimonadota bacterium]
MEKIILASPRGFCAGVAYAIEVLDLAIQAYGVPIYMRHAIVHNEHVVRSFQRRGVIFVEEISEIPPGSTVVFSAHGVSPAVRREAAERHLRVIDATCPLVSKVHREVMRFASQGYHILYIGHAGHVEALGTMGHAPERMTLVQTVEDAERVQVPEGKLAVTTQTTLSVDEVERIMTVLRRRFPHLVTPPKEDICYATTNRQRAVKELAKHCDLILVVGSRSSSNSNRLREVAMEAGASAYLLLEPEEVRPEWRTDYRCVGITSGASTPESSVEAIIGELLRGQEHVPVQTLETAREDITFLPPRALVASAGASSR